jgi:hypothetical protein
MNAKVRKNVEKNYRETFIENINLQCGELNFCIKAGKGSVKRRCVAGARLMQR